MPRYSISNVPTNVKKYPPDPADIGVDWGIYAKSTKQGLRVKFEFEINFAFAHLILFAMERVYAENDKNAEKI